MASYDLLKRLVSSVSVSGSEKTTAELLKKELKPYAAEIRTDRVGNLIARKGKGGPKIMLAAHMDEIGLIVKYIGKDGFIRFSTVGGWDDRILPAGKFIIHGSRGPVTGVVGIKPPHLLSKDEMKQAIKHKDMYLDIGAKDKKEVEKAGISVGDFITHSENLEKLLGKRITGRGLDNKIGCLVMIEAFKKLKDFKGTLYAVGSSMEEIGLIGVRGAAFGINPDVVIALDTGMAGDSPDFKPGECPASLGSGPVIVLKDGGQIMNPQVKKWLKASAKKAKVILQDEVTEGGTTDAAVIPTIREGIPSGCLCVATRYIHTGVSVADTKDIDSCIKVLLEALKSAKGYF